MAATVADSNETSALSILGDALEAAAESIGDASANASESAKIAAAKVKSGVSAGAYHGAYGVAFGLVFTGVFLKELLPADSAVRRGFEEGAEAAFDAVAARKASAVAVVPDDIKSELNGQAAGRKRASPAARKTVRVTKKAAV